MLHAGDARRLAKGVNLMYKHILVPVDGSACSDLAAQHALALAQAMQSKLTFLHVVDVSRLIALGPDAVVVDDRADLEATGRETLAHWQAESQSRGVKADTELLSGVPAECILARADECDAIVMGTHGRTGMRRVLLGSVAEHVLHHAKCPVIVTRHR